MEKRWPWGQSTPYVGPLDNRVVLYGAPPPPERIDPFKPPLAPPIFPFQQLQPPVDVKAIQDAIERLERLLVSSTKAMHERLNAIAHSLDAIESSLKGVEGDLAARKKPRKRAKRKKS